MEKYIIPNLANASHILKLVALYDEGITLAQLCSELDVPRSTVYRILKTLESEELLTKLGRRYHLGVGVLCIGLRMASTYRLREHSQTVLYDLALSTGFTAHVAVPSRFRSLILEVCDGRITPRVLQRPGTHFPLHCSATGKIFLSHIFRESISEIEKTVGFERHTRNTITVGDSLAEEVSSIIRKGYAVDVEELSLGMCSLAVPILDPNGVAVASIGVIGPTSAFTMNTISVTAALVKQAATRVYLANRRDLD